MRVTWAVQTNLLNAIDVEAIRCACLDQGHLFTSLKTIPFSNELPDISTNSPTIFYGSARQTILIARSGRWNPGVFFDDADFCYRAYCHNLGEVMLNHDARRMSAHEVASSPASLAPDATYFVRPDADDKAFAGTLMTGEELVEWATRLTTLDTEMMLDAPMVIATPRTIHTEWRVFMSGEEVITSSRYRVHGALSVLAHTPEDVLKFASTCAKTWHPARAYVMDIARMEDGTLRVIEFNGINSSGFYAADIPAIIASLSMLAHRPAQ